MINITRLNELYSAITQSKWERCQANNGTCQCGLVWSSEPDTVVANCGSDPAHPDELPKITDEQMVANSDWIAESHNAWPVVAAELTRLREAHGELSSLRQRVAELGIELALHGDEVPNSFIVNKLTEMLQVKIGAWQWKKAKTAETTTVGET